MRPTTLLTAAIGSLALSALPAFAGILAVDPTSIVKGTALFSKTIGPLSLNASVDYGVYAPGTFATTFGPGSDPSGGTAFVYAYQVTNAGPNEADFFSVGIASGDSTGAANIENLPAAFFPGGVPSDDPSFTPAAQPFTSATWDYGSPHLLATQSSSILLFTSPLPPGLDLASVQGGALIATNELPSPTPEPGTATLLLAAGSTLLSRRRKA